jgi:PAS domain S-box-containing protein
MTAYSRTDEFNLIDEPSVAHALRVTLVAIAASALAISAFTLFLRWRLTPQLALVAGASSLVALVLSRSGRIRPAMMLPLLSIIYAVLHLAVRSDGIQNIGLAILPVLIMVGSLVLNGLTLVFFTASIILAVVGMLAIRYFVLLAERYSTNDMGDLFIFALTCATAALVGRLFALRIKEGFQRAQAYCLALGLAERNVRLVADSLSEMVVAYDMQRSLTYANSGAEKLTGYGLAELQAAAPLSWTHPEDRVQVRALWDQAFDGQTVDQVAYRLITKNATVKWAAGSWGPVVDETGHQVGVRVTCHDITERIVAEQALEETTQKFRTIVEEVTERKRAEEALRENEQRLVSIYNTVRDVIFHLVVEPDGQFRFVSVNAAFLRVTGLSPEAVVGKTVNEVIPEPSLTMVLGKYRQAVEEKTVVFWEETSDYPTGRLTGEVSVAPVFDNKGRCTHLVGSVHDITERKRAEALVRESEERFRSLADTAPVMIWVCGPDKRATFFNKRCLDFTGRTMEEKLGDGWTAGLHPEDREQFLGTYSSSIDARQEFRSVFRLRRADGEYRWVLCTGVPRSAPDGIFAGYIGSCIDITDQKRAEETLRRNVDEIAHLNRVAALGEMATSLAHELNQPLAAILTNAEAASRFLNRESPNLARVRGCLTAIAADDERAAEVIKRLRSLLKKNQSQASLIDLNEVVSDALRLVNNDAMLRETRVRIELHPKLPPVLGDRVQLCQVVLNLLVNGLQAAAEQPPVERWVLVRTAEANGGGVELTVEDSGKGIAESDLARVFEPFFTSKREGLGMGLSISQSIVQAHGGQIWIEHSASHGALFHCVLPVAQQAAVGDAK